MNGKCPCCERPIIRRVENVDELCKRCLRREKKEKEIMIQLERKAKYEMVTYR